MVSGDGDIALGSIIVPLHVNCRASRANAAMLKAMISNAIVLVQNIDEAPSISGSDATRLSVIFLECEIGNFDPHQMLNGAATCNILDDPH